ncbi:MAG: WG repeat-containing protein [Bacteroidales bacterium]|nr:WG repeat-containing protein [Bacteroidales bacterium]
MKMLKFLAKPFLWIEGRWSRCSKWFKRLVGLLFICPVFIVGLLAVFSIIYDNIEFSATYKPYIWDEKQLSERLEVHEYSDGIKRLYDRQNEKYIMDDVCWVSDVSVDDSLAVIAFPGKRGYINIHTAEIVIEPQYKSAWIFSEGLAAVRNQEGMVGFINNKNEMVIPFKFDAKGDGISTPYVFKSGRCFMSDSLGHLGIIDREGNWQLEPVYDYIDWHTVDGFRKVQKDGFYGLLDSTFNVVYKPIYKEILFKEDIDNIVLVSDSSRCIVDYSGNVVISFLYDNIVPLGYPTTMSETPDGGYYNIEYIVSNYAKYSINYNYGILNSKTGKIITPAIYSDIEMISDRLFSVNEGAGISYLIDLNGKPIE